MTAAMKDRSRRPKIKNNFLSVPDYHALVTGMDRYEWKLLTQFLVLSGLRIGELAALNREDVDVLEEKICVGRA